MLASGPANWRIYYQLSVPAPSALAASLTFSEPNGSVFETDPGSWDSGISYLYSDLSWTFADGSLFFQNAGADRSRAMDGQAVTAQRRSTCGVVLHRHLTGGDFGVRVGWPREGAAFGLVQPKRARSALAEDAPTRTRSSSAR